LTTSSNLVGCSTGRVRGLCALGHAAGEDTELTVRIRQAGGWGER
jgi:hypothetical protein